MVRAKHRAQDRRYLRGIGCGGEANHISYPEIFYLYDNRIQFSLYSLALIVKGKLGHCYIYLSGDAGFSPASYHDLMNLPVAANAADLWAGLLPIHFADIISGKLLGRHQLLHLVHGVHLRYHGHRRIGQDKVGQIGIAKKDARSAIRAHGYATGTHLIVRTLQAHLRLPAFGHQNAESVFFGVRHTDEVFVIGGLLNIHLLLVGVRVIHLLRIAVRIIHLLPIGIKILTVGVFNIIISTGSKQKAE